MRYVCNGFGQLIQKSYLYCIPHGYTHYVLIRVPDYRDPTDFDTRIRTKYQISDCAKTRQRRKSRGVTDIRYLRFKRTAILWIFPGNKQHLLFEQEQHINDLTTIPIEAFGYTLMVGKNGKPELKMSRKRFDKAKRKLLKISYHDQDKVQRTFNKVAPLYKYKGVIRQLEQLRREVNFMRAKVGLPPIERR
jgi:hypothetical protein